MIITPFSFQDTLQAQTDTAPYDTIWGQAEVPVQEPTPLERVMLAEDKLYVVLAVVLIVWLALILFVFRTDRKLRKLERTLEERIPEESHEF
jgi:CcmD family protein